MLVGISCLKRALKTSSPALDPSASHKRTFWESSPKMNKLQLKSTFIFLSVALLVQTLFCISDITQLERSDVFWHVVCLRRAASAECGTTQSENSLSPPSWPETSTARRHSTEVLGPEGKHRLYRLLITHTRHLRLSDVWRETFRVCFSFNWHSNCPRF